MKAYIPLLMQGTLTTVELWILASTISCMFGLAVGTVRCARLRIAGISFTADIITVILRGVPLYAQLLIAYFILPQVCGLNLSAFTTGVITLGSVLALMQAKSSEVHSMPFLRASGLQRKLLAIVQASNCGILSSLRCFLMLYLRSLMNM